MRWITLAAGILMTIGCAAPAPTPLAGDQARLELSTQRPGDRISAYRLDGELVRGLRFPDLHPGAHNAQMRFRYEVPGSANNAGMLGEPQYRTCILGIDYDDFSAGNTYRFVADRRGIRPAGWLESADHQRLARASIVRCGPGV